MTAADPVREASRRLLAQATLGAVHAVRNALQVLGAYAGLLQDGGPAREALRASLSRVLELLGSLELLAGAAPERPPEPGELRQALQLLPELFVYALRDRRVGLEVRAGAPLSGRLLRWELFLLASLLTEELLQACPSGLEGRLQLRLEGEELDLEWIPGPGSLPFPLAHELSLAAHRGLAESLELELRPTASGLGLKIVPAGSRTECRPGSFLT